MTRETAHAFELFTLKSLGDKLFRAFVEEMRQPNQNNLCLKFCPALSPPSFLSYPLK